MRFSIFQSKTALCFGARRFLAQPEPFRCCGDEPCTGSCRHEISICISSFFKPCFFVPMVALCLRCRCTKHHQDSFFLGRIVFHLGSPPRGQAAPPSDARAREALETAWREVQKLSVEARSEEEPLREAKAV